MSTNTCGPVSEEWRGLIAQIQDIMSTNTCGPVSKKRRRLNAPIQDNMSTEPPGPVSKRRRFNSPESPIEAPDEPKKPFHIPDEIIEKVLHALIVDCTRWSRTQLLKGMQISRSWYRCGIPLMRRFHLAITGANSEVGTSLRQTMNNDRDLTTMLPGGVWNALSGSDFLLNDRSLVETAVYQKIDLTFLRCLTIGVDGRVLLDAESFLSSTGARIRFPSLKRLSFKLIELPGRSGDWTGVLDKIRRFIAFGNNLDVEIRFPERPHKFVKVKKLVRFVHDHAAVYPVRTFFLTWTSSWQQVNEFRTVYADHGHPVHYSCPHTKGRVSWFAHSKRLRGGGLGPLVGVSFITHEAASMFPRKASATATICFVRTHQDVLRGKWRMKHLCRDDSDCTVSWVPRRKPNKWRAYPVQVPRAATRWEAGRTLLKLMSWDWVCSARSPPPRPARKLVGYIKKLAEKENLGQST